MPTTLGLYHVGGALASSAAALPMSSYITPASVTSNPRAAATVARVDSVAALMVTAAVSASSAAPPRMFTMELACFSVTGADRVLLTAAAGVSPIDRGVITGALLAWAPAPPPPPLPPAGPPPPLPAPPPPAAAASAPGAR